jgi:hypothetical protein
MLLEVDAPGKYQDLFPGVRRPEHTWPLPNINAKVKNGCSYAFALYTCSGLHRNKLNLLIHAALPTYLHFVVYNHHNIYKNWVYVLRIIHSYFFCNCAIRVRNFEINVITKKFKLLALCFERHYKEASCQELWWYSLCLGDWLTATDS